MGRNEKERDGKDIMRMEKRMREDEGNEEGGRGG